MSENQKIVEALRWFCKNHLEEREIFEADVLFEAAERIETLERALASAFYERDKAVADIKSLLEEIEKIRLSVTLDGDTDDDLADICRGFCKNYGESCFKPGGAEWACKNFRWRGVGDEVETGEGA